MVALGSMLPDGPAAAEGTLGQTPFAHLAVYALDKRITGEIFLAEPAKDGTEKGPTHVIRFEAGVPTKIKVGDDFARLGELLLERKAITQATLEGALATHGGLLGDVLVLSGYAESNVIDEALADQFKRRMCRFYSLSPETQFKYFDKSDTLVHWGGDPSTADPFSLLWAGLEAHGDRSTLMGATLDLLKSTQLKLHPRAPYHRFCFSADATDVVELLALDPTGYEELLELGSVPVETVRKVLYALVITRQLDLGKSTLPVGVEERPATVAKVALRSQVHRIGAAAPDAPGDGERTPVRPISIRRGTTGKFEVLPREEDPTSTAVAPESVGPSSNRGEAIASSSASSSSGAASARSSQPDGVGPTSSQRDVAVKSNATSSADRSSKADVAAAPASKPGDAAPPAKPSASKAAGEKPAAEKAAADKPAGEKPAPKAPPPKAPAPSAAASKAKANDELQDSQKRLIAEAVRGKPTKELVAMALSQVDDKELAGALEICRVAREAEPESEEVRSAAMWARSHQPGADLKVFTIELDEALRDDDKLVVTRFVRAMLRKRLGEDNGAIADLKRLLEIDPGHDRARKELERLDKPTKPDEARDKGDPGFLKRLFRR